LAINPSLLDILCCPAEYDGGACHGHLTDLGHGLRCETCGLVYPVEDGIPVLLADHAMNVCDTASVAKGESDTVAGHKANGGAK